MMIGQDLISNKKLLCCIKTSGFIQTSMSKIQGLLNSFQGLKESEKY